MRSLLVDLLPFAVGIAVSPVPVLAVLLALISQQTRRTGAGLAAGWVTGIVVVTGSSAVFSDALRPAGDSSRWGPFVEIAVGAILLVVGWRQWDRRREPARSPRWMVAVTHLGTGRAFGLGFLLIVVNPKNLPLAVAAGLTISRSPVSVAGAVGAVVVFATAAGATLAVPVLVYLGATPRRRERLDRLRSVLLRHQAAIVGLSLAIVGAVFMIKGAIDL